jgi:membrane protease YdiL (CAAX protease family)
MVGGLIKSHRKWITLSPAASCGSPRGLIERFSHWRNLPSDGKLPLHADPMSDPTAIVLSACMALAFGVFATTAAMRSRRQLAQPGEGIDAEMPVDADSPYSASAEASAQPPLLTHRMVPIWPYRAMDFVGLAFLFLMFSLLGISATGAPAGEAPKLPSAANLIISMGLQVILAGLTMAFVVWRIHPVEWLGLRWRQWPWVFLIAPAMVVCLWLVFGLLSAIGYLEWVQKLGGDPVQDTVKLLQTTRDPVILILMGMAAVVVAPVCEEIIFRGYLYPAAKKFTGSWVAAGCSALVFSIAHGNLGALLPLFIFGLVLVWLYEKTRSIWAPIAVHLVFNGATVVIQLLAPFLTRLAEKS